MTHRDQETAAGGALELFRSPRWLGLTAAMVVFMAVCVTLGFWQWHRFEDRLTQARQVDAVYESEPAPLEEAITPADDGSTAGVVGPREEWHPVELTGRYLFEVEDVEHAAVLLRNRPVDGTPAAHVLAPFLAETGTGPIVVLVDRGWLAAASLEDGAAAPEPPAGQVTVTGRLRQAEDPSDRDRPAGQVYTLDPGTALEAARGEVPWEGNVRDASGKVLATTVGGERVPVLDGYLAAAGESPPGAVELGGFSQPSSRWGLNLSYAIQWWLFAAGAPVALVILARRELAEDSPRPRRRPTAEEDEDALLDAQLRG